MTIHWEHYKDAAAICHQLEAESIGEDPRVRLNLSLLKVSKVEGKDCYVYTGERTKARILRRPTAGLLRDTRS